MAEIEEQGLSAQPTEQKPKQTSDEAVEFDPKKTYKLRGKPVKGKELESMIYRGEGYSKIQSELDQARVQLTQMQNDNALLMQELSRIDRERETKGLIDQALSSTKPARGQEDGFNDDFLGNNEEPPQFDSNKLLSMLRDMQTGIKQEVASEVTAKAETDIKTLLKQLLQEQETQKRTKQYIDDLDVMVKHQLQTMYPNFASADEAGELFDKVANVRKRMRGLQVEIGGLWERQDPTWLEKNNENMELEAELADLMGEIKQQESTYRELSDARAVMGLGAKPFREVQNEERPSKELDVKKWLAERETKGKKAWEAQVKAMNLSR